MYDAKLVILNASDGKKYLYDIIDIKKSPQKNKFWVHKILEIENVSNLPASTKIGTEAGQTIADDSEMIPQPPESVNKK